MDDYKDIKDSLKPRRDFAASDELRNRIDATLASYTHKSKSLWWIWGVGVSCVAAAVLILILIPTDMSAKEILTETLNALLKTEGIEMSVEIRTRPMENFRYINLSDDFVRHNISVVKSDSSLTWRVDKGGRTAAGNGEVIYNWIDQLNVGWRTSNADPKELLGEMAILLTPEKILESELQNCLNNSDAHYEVDKKNGVIVLTVHSKPQGDFSNPYMLNASIGESENIRRYVIDADSRHLISASVSVINGRKEIEILRITNITYGQPRTNVMALPSDVRFIDLQQSSVQGLMGLTATEAASAFLSALETWNISVLERAIDLSTLDAMYRDEFQGAKLETIGNAFISGNSGNTYVPYSLRMPNGSVKHHNLVLQKSPQGGWIVIGGL